MQDKRITCRLRIEHHARRHGDEVLPSIIDLRVCELALDADEKLLQHLLVRLRIDESKLIPVQTIERETARHILQDALRDLPQNCITDLMVECLVHHAEIINAHDEETAAIPRLTRRAQRLAKILRELIAVQQPRHRVCRITTCKLTDRPNEEIRLSILGQSDLSLEPQPCEIALRIRNAEVQLPFPPFRHVHQRGKYRIKGMAILYADQWAQHVGNMGQRLRRQRIISDKCRRSKKHIGSRIHHEGIVGGCVFHQIKDSFVLPEYRAQRCSLLPCHLPFPLFSIALWQIN